MPESDPLYPQCENCDFYDRLSQTSAKCRKHRFVMPEVDWQIVCKDWAHDGSSVDLSGFDAQTLHYYTAASGEIVHAPLRRFEDLKRMMISVRLRQDKEFGWVIYVGSQSSQFFPAPGTRVDVMISRRKCKFQIANPQRELAREMVPYEGTWSEVHHTQQSFMLFSTEHHELVYTWLKGFMDIDRYIADAFVPSIFAFMEVAGNNTDYVLYADSLAYQQFLLDK